MENTKEIKVTKTHYCVCDCKEPCFEVSNGFAMVRIAPCYHYFGLDTIMLTEFLDGEFNSREEWKGDFDSLTKSDAMRIAKEYSVYL